MSVVKCSVIIRPLTHFTIFTDRVLRATVCTIWTLSLAVGAATNVGVTEAHFSPTTFVAYVRHRSRVFVVVFAAVTFVTPTLIIMIAYAKMFLAVRRQVRSMPTAVLGPHGTVTIFGSSVRSAKNIFVMCAAYWLTYLPAVLSVMLSAAGLRLPEEVQFAISWIYNSSSAVNGFLYIALHSSVRRELRRYLPRRRRASVAAAPGHGQGQRYRDCVNNGVGTPVPVMTSSRQHATPQLSTSVLWLGMAFGVMFLFARTLFSRAVHICRW